MKPWDILKSELVFNHRWAKVRRDAVQLENGQILDDYHYWESEDFAMIFALTDDQQVIVVQQYRHAVKTIASELPSGMIDSTDSDSAAAAQRELLEETGYRVNHIQALGVFDVSPPKSTVRAHAYLATGAHKTEGQKLEPSEAITVSTVPLADWLAMIAEGVVKDLASIATTLRALQALKHMALTTISSPSPS